jgi:hypothetical protein
LLSLLETGGREDIKMKEAGSCLEVIFVYETAHNRRCERNAKDLADEQNVPILLCKPSCMLNT